MVESYGHADEVNYNSIKKDKKPHLVAAKATTLFEEKDTKSTQKVGARKSSAQNATGKSLVNRFTSGKRDKDLPSTVDKRKTSTTYASSSL